MRGAACHYTAAIGLAAGALLVSAAQAAQEGPVEVEIVGRAYQPTTLTIGLGQTVVWHNGSLTPHTVTSTAGLFGSSPIHSGESYSVTFSKAGTFDYKCTIHPTMKGEVAVLDLAPKTLQLRVSARRTSHVTTAVAHVQAARSGPVLLQARRGGAWRTVAHGTLDAQGRARIILSDPGRRLLRVAVPAQFGQPREVSPSKPSPV